MLLQMLAEILPIQNIIGMISQKYHKIKPSIDFSEGTKLYKNKQDIDKQLDRLNEEILENRMDKIELEECWTEDEISNKSIS